MSTGAIVAACVVATALVSAGVLVAKAVRAWAKSLSELRKEIAAARLAMANLKTELAEQRGKDKLEMREWVDGRLVRHAAECPGRDPAGARPRVAAGAGEG
jgi:hypothetical protein